MPPSADRGPVQTRLALPTLGNGIRTGGGGGRRRIFVQTERGSVLGMEVDREDRVHSVKKKMQSLLNVSTEQTSLVYGDLVLKNDLSDLRNYSPLLLLRGGMHRSYSTPSFSPAGPDAAADGSQPVEIVGGGSTAVPARVRRMVKRIVKAIRHGVEPVPVSSGLGGAYYFRNCKGESIAILKPTDEEPFAPNNPKGFVGKKLGQPGLKKSVRVGETGIREVAAYLLDHAHFANVPPTVLVKATHTVFHVDNAGRVARAAPAVAVAKIASCQEFVRHDFDASDYGASQFPATAVHRIGILDIRILNTDRHAGNILLRKVPSTVDARGFNTGNTLELIPIDHGLCLPETLEDPYFEWLHWPQSSLPFSEDELEYICHLDAAKDVEMLRTQLPMMREACLRMLTLCTMFLKAAATCGLCLAEMGEMMSRECGWEDKSRLEILCMQAKIEAEQAVVKGASDQEDACNNHLDPLEPCQFEMDTTSTTTTTTTTTMKEIPLAVLQESPSEGDDSDLSSDMDKNDSRKALPWASPLTRNARTSKLRCRKTLTVRGGGRGGGGSTSRSEGGPINFSVMSEQEWVLFLQHFQELLNEALKSRSDRLIIQRKRLGSSCQF